MLNIVIGFDYEIFFGENYKNIKQVLFDPTQRICKILKRNNVSAVFFADVCSIFQHQKYGLMDYVNGFTDQIKLLADSGQDVQLHIHPHWFRSDYDSENGWVFPEDHYRIHDYFSDSEKNSEYIISEGINYLSKTIATVKTNYRCIAFRAGGYCLQPYTKLIPLLRKNGILIDSSVAMYQSNLSDNLHYYDYRNLPQSLNYWINSSIDIADSQNNKMNNQCIFEVPIGYYQRNLLRRIIKKVCFNQKWGFEHGEVNGRAMSHVQVGKNQWIKDLLTYNSNKIMLSPDYMSADVLKYAVELLYKKYNAKNDDVYVAMVCHPKCFTGEAFNNLERFLDLILSMSRKFRIINTDEIYSRIRGGQNIGKRN